MENLFVLGKESNSTFASNESYCSSIYLFLTCKSCSHQRASDISNNVECLSW